MGPLLGFPDEEYINKELFVQPNRDAFHQVVHFLFTLVDDKRCAKDFRDCFPTIDKKTEALFRRNAFNWYNELAEIDTNGLYTIQHSLFLCPGGGKFIEFMNQFIRFVALHRIRKMKMHEQSVVSPKNEIINLLCQLRKVKSGPEKHQLSSQNILGHEISSILKVLVIENMKNAKLKFSELNQCYEDGKDVIDKLTKQYRCQQDSLNLYKEEEKQIKGQIEQRIRSKNEIYCSTYRRKKNAQPVEQLKSICIEMQKEHEKILTECWNILSLIVKNLEIIESIQEPNTVSKNIKKKIILNVTPAINSIAMSDVERDKVGDISVNDRKLHCIFESMIAQIMNNSNFLSFDSKTNNLPMKKIVETGKLVSSYMSKFQQLQADIQKDLIETNSISRKHQNELKHIDWENQIVGNIIKSKKSYLWMSHGPLAQPMKQISFRDINKEYASENASKDNRESCFLLSSFGGKYTPINPSEMTQVISGKSDDYNPVMSSTIMFGHRPLSTASSRIQIDEVPISPISPVGKSDSLMSESIFLKDNEVKNWKTMTSDEVFDLMTEHINKYDEAETIEDECLILET